MSYHLRTLNYHAKACFPTHTCFATRTSVKLSCLPHSTLFPNSSWRFKVFQSLSMHSATSSKSNKGPLPEIWAVALCYAALMLGMSLHTHLRRDLRRDLHGAYNRCKDIAAGQSAFHIKRQFVNLGAGATEAPTSRRWLVECTGRTRKRTTSS